MSLHICDCGARYSSAALVIACADSCHGDGLLLMKKNARQQNRDTLRKIIQSHTGCTLTPSQLDDRIARIVQDAEAGKLDHHDSMILGAFAVATMRECK